MSNYTLEHLYNLLLPKLQVLETERIQVKKKIALLKKTTIIIWSVVSLIGVFFYGLEFAIILLIPAFMVFLIGRTSLQKNYKKNYKANILRAMIAALGPNYTYNPTGNLDESVLNESKLFKEFNHLRCEDLIEGKFEKYSFQQADVYLAYKIKGRTSSPRRSTDIFDGLFIACTLSIAFPLNVWIFAKGQVPARVRLGFQKIDIDNLNFNEHFEVFTDGEQPVANVLPKSMLDTLVKVNQELDGEKISLAILGNSIYIAVYTFKDLFEPPLDVPITDFEQFKKDFHYLYFTTNLVNRLLGMQ